MTRLYLRSLLVASELKSDQCQWRKTKKTEIHHVNPMEKPDFGHFSTFKPPKHTVKIILAKNEYQIRNPLIFLHILGTHVVADEQKKNWLYSGFSKFLFGHKYAHCEETSHRRQPYPHGRRRVNMHNYWKNNFDWLCLATGL